MIFGVALRGG